LAGVFTMTRWHFDDTNTWAGEGGQLPLLTNNLTGIPSWSSNAVRIDSASPALLAYPVVETNGNINIYCQTGSVLFYFKPAWNSANAGGDGPGVSGRLIEMGSYNPEFTNGWWSLYLNPDGTQFLDFQHVASDCAGLFAREQRLVRGRPIVGQWRRRGLFPECRRTHQRVQNRERC
jgi:hypothetical protein